MFTLGVTLKKMINANVANVYLRYQTLCPRNAYASTDTMLEEGRTLLLQEYEQCRLLRRCLVGLEMRISVPTYKLRRANLCNSFLG